MDKIICINRQYGSAGRLIGKKIAKEYGIPFYDNEIITQAAKETGFDESTFTRAEQKATNSLLYSIAMGMNVFSSGQDGMVGGLSLDDRLFLAQSNVVRKVADEGPCVIVGRGADYVLKDYENVVNIFISASLDYRIKRAINDYSVPERKAAELVTKRDKARSNFYKYHTGESWNNLTNYDIVMRSDLVGVDAAADTIINYINNMK